MRYYKGKNRGVHAWCITLFIFNIKINISLQGISDVVLIRNHRLSTTSLQATLRQVPIIIAYNLRNRGQTFC